MHHVINGRVSCAPPPPPQEPNPINAAFNSDLLKRSCESCRRRCSSKEPRSDYELNMKFKSTNKTSLGGGVCQAPSRTNERLLNVHNNRQNTETNSTPAEGPTVYQVIKAEVYPRRCVAVETRLQSLSLLSHVVRLK